MVRMIASILVLASASVSSLAATPVKLVPRAFQGHWEANAKQCSASTGDGGLVISADTLQFYESEGSVQKVIVHGVNDITIVSQLSGEGESWTEQTRFKLSKDGNTLSDVSNAKRFVRHRCKGSGR